MPLTLSAVQRRVLGVVIEKSFTTPEQYPLTVNAIIAGCNQKSNRDPVLDLGDGDVIQAVQELMHMNLVKLAATGPGARSNRYEHDVTSQFPWSPREQAVLTELMLRGPQTVGELRTRSNRMVPFPDLQTVQNILDAFVGAEPPEVVVLPRAAGQSAIRYRHTFHADGEEVETGQSAAAAPTAPPPRDASLEKRVDDLESRVADLERRIEAILG